jgi:tetratricopeptide (TPR) repeat protein
MPYLRQRGNQLAIVQGVRDPETGNVQQHILFTVYSKAEALKIVGRQDVASSMRFQSLMEFQYPSLKFDWAKINKAIHEKMNVLPDLYNYKTMRLQAQFRGNLCAFTKQLILNDPQNLFSSAQLIQENRHELEYIADLIHWRLKLKDQKASEWNVDNQFYWRQAIQGNRVPPEAEEQAEEYYLKGEYDKAESIFKLLIECFNNYAEGYNYLGLIALEKEEIEEAIACFELTMELGRKKFPKRFARKNYWRDHATRAYMRGMQNMTLSLNRAGRYDEALLLCERLEKECGDDITAAAHRAAIYMNLGCWRSASEAAVYLHKISASESLIASLAFFEMKTYKNTLHYFIHGTMNQPLTSKMINGDKSSHPKSHEEYRDYSGGIDILHSLHQFRKTQSIKSKQFFKRLINHHIIKGLIDELETTREKLKKERTVEDRSAFDRLQEMTSFDFAVRESTKLENELP